MSAFPTGTQYEGTRFDRFEDIEAQVSAGGEAHIWVGLNGNLGIGDQIVVLIVDDVGRVELETHRTDNELATFDFVDQTRPAITWTASWAGIPKFEPINRASTIFFARCPLYLHGSDE